MSKSPNLNEPDLQPDPLNEAGILLPHEDKKSVRSLDPSTPPEINDRLRRRYLDRLSIRVRKLRRDLIEKNWRSLRSECSQLSQSSENFGFQNISNLASLAEESLPVDRTPRALTPHHSKRAIEALISAIDLVLENQKMPRA